MKRNELLKLLNLDFSKFDYYKWGGLYRFEKKDSVTEYFQDMKWKPAELNISLRALDPYRGLDIDLLSEKDMDIILDAALKGTKEKLED